MHWVGNGHDAKISNKDRQASKKPYQTIGQQVSVSYRFAQHVRTAYVGASRSLAAVNAARFVLQILDTHFAFVAYPHEFFPQHGFFDTSNAVPS
jgi:hypothetical protein